MMSEILPVFLISFIATLIRSTFGFGESLVAVPLFVLFMRLEIAVPLSVLMSVLVALLVVVQDHKAIQFSSAKSLILYALLGIPVGLMILKYASEYWVKIGLGLLIISYSIYALVSKRVKYLEADSQFWLFICGFLSGILGGAYGVNGPPLVVYGNMRKWSAQHFRATLQAYFLPASFIGIVGYVIQGLLGWIVIKYFLYSLPAIIPATFAGRYFNHKINGSDFFRYLYIGLICVGLFLILYTLK
ncbi:sulfite exporter TauE/SafE family protein [Niabella yanshanensis]|uniref:Probable membrane transporter protein n=1 Tax=Niabella yanshanensis TaxID=577386 RepID=A0ABZ0W8Z9_9BACT|nr:sulfite exporter TauE/SafE family protein [Niabella yanshanensis]WQD38012.1 sulfite exporter TauE/SafE family protein [Niabella yanshanensis]